MIEAPHARRPFQRRDEQIGRELPDVAVRHHRQDQRVAREGYRRRSARDGMELHGYLVYHADDPRAQPCAGARAMLTRSRWVFQRSQQKIVWTLKACVYVTHHFFLFFPPFCGTSPPPSVLFATCLSSSSSAGTVRSSPFATRIASSMNGDP